MKSLTTSFLLLLLFSPDLSSANTQLCGEQQQQQLTLANSTTGKNSETKEDEEGEVDNINGTKNIPVIDSKKKMLALLRSAYVRDQMEAIKPQAFKPAFARNVTEFTQSIELDSIEVLFPMNTIVGGSNCRASLLFIRRCFPRPGWWADVCSLRCMVDPTKK